MYTAYIVYAELFYIRGISIWGFFGCAEKSPLSDTRGKPYRDKQFWISNAEDWYIQQGEAEYFISLGETAASEVFANKPHLFCDNFFNQAIDEQSIIHLPATVKRIMDSWTHQSGFPVITLNASTGIVKQEPFYLERVENQTLLSHK